MSALSDVVYTVASYMGAWIETQHLKGEAADIQSHPTWVRGLKLRNGKTQKDGNIVASYMGAWIETANGSNNKIQIRVASYMGAWIETEYHESTGHKKKSHPTWVRGLKLNLLTLSKNDLRRILHGCVD